MDVNKTLDALSREGKSAEQISLENMKIKKDYDRMIWARDIQEIQNIQKEGTTSAYNDMLTRWSQQKCSPFTPADKRKRTEMALIQHSKTYDPANINGLQQIFNE